MPSSQSSVGKLFFSTVLHRVHVDPRMRGSSVYFSQDTSNLMYSFIKSPRCDPCDPGPRSRSLSLIGRRPSNPVIVGYALCLIVDQVGTSAGQRTDGRMTACDRRVGLQWSMYPWPAGRPTGFPFHAHGFMRENRLSDVFKTNLPLVPRGRARPGQARPGMSVRGKSRCERTHFPLFQIL